MGTYWPWRWGLCSQCVLSHFSHVHLSDSMDCRLPGSSVHGILQARTLEWVVMPSSRVYFQPRDQTHIGCNSCTAEGFFTTEPLGKPRVEGSVQFSHSIMSTLCNSMNLSMPGLPVHHQLPEFTQNHVHWVSDTIQPSHPLSPFPPPLNLSQHQDLFKWVSSLHQVAKV